METNIDPNFDQLLIICGIICVIVIAFVLFMIKFPDSDEEYTDNIDGVSDARLAHKDSMKTDEKGHSCEDGKM